MPVYRERRGAVIKTREWAYQDKNGSRNRIHPKKGQMRPRGFALKAKLSDALPLPRKTKTKQNLPCQTSLLVSKNQAARCPAFPRSLCKPKLCPYN